MRLLFLTVGRVNYDCNINFYEPLKEICSQVIQFNYLKRYQEVGARVMNKEILYLVHREKPDLVLCHMYQEQIFKSTMERITRSGITTLGWFSDDHWRFADYSIYWAPVLDYCVTTDKKAYHRYKQMGYSTILSQWAANPQYYKPYPVEQIYDVTFVGGCYGVRKSVIEYLSSHGVNIKAFGRGWGRYIPFEDMVKIYSQSKINLNISASSANPDIRQIKGRNFEVPMAGGFLLTDYAPGLEKYFEIGKEIVCYESLDDAVEKIRYYLCHDEERKKIAKASYERAIRDHIWHRRFEAIFSEIAKKEIPEKEHQPIFGEHKWEKMEQFFLPAESRLFKVLRQVVKIVKRIGGRSTLAIWAYGKIKRFCL